MPRNKDIRPVATLTVGLVAAFLSLGGLSGSAIGAQPPIPNSRGHAPLVPGDDSRAGSRLQAPTNLRGVRAQSAPTTVALPAAPTITRGPATPTTDTSATFEFGDTDPSATFLCSLDDARFRPCTSPVSYSRLSYSSHTFRVQAVNAGGTSAEASYTVQVTRPAPPPSPTIDERPQNPTTDTNATFVFHDTDPSATFRCRLDGGPYRACPSTITYTSLSYAKHTFGVQAVGSSGLTSSATTYSWRIQKPPAPPPPTIGSGPSNPTTETSATFIFEDTDTAATFQCSLDGSRFAACTSPQIYAGPLAAGNHTFRVRATGVGGTSAATSYAWRLTPVP
ncbi:MAG TPA: hypothetical protein VNH40_09200, partial [Gaiellaceae bacterium]|nr:hypothetical protein [Gaiellaceae bacterium]